MKILAKRLAFYSFLGVLVAAAPSHAADGALKLTVDSATGAFSIADASGRAVVQNANSALRVEGRWLQASEYPHHAITKTAVRGPLGDATQWVITNSGRIDAPDLRCFIQSYSDQPFGEIRAEAQNNAGKLLHVQAFRLIGVSSQNEGGALVNIAGPASQTRVLSDSFSEDRPAVQIRDLSNADNGLHRGVGSQLIYNRQSHQSWFVGALTSDKFISVMRLHMHPASYEVDSTGTTEFTALNSLKTSPPEDHVELSLSLAPGSLLASERLLFGVGDDYHHQLDVYGRLIRDLHHARVTAATPIGWWSWTAYYFGLNEGTALSNAEWLAQHLKPLGYDFFHIDEGYDFARGEYATEDAALFPRGMGRLEQKVTALGLVSGLWTAPFEVSERSWVFENHPDWLVKNASGKPIHAGVVTNNKDALYVLDVTNPAAQQYLRQTYQSLVQRWNIRYIKMDFMEDAGIEGFYYKPETTALEAQRIGLNIIRSAVGDDVLLDKDGSEMLNPVGIVDMGRISQDTGHTFVASKDAGTGMAARYFMNRNYFVADPDAFSVSTQTLHDQAWHGGEKPLTLDEAKVSIALTAISGGMFEIGDDLPTLAKSPERVALVENRDLLNIAKLGRASVPVDLMSYEPADLQPSIFLLKESDRQQVLTVFNWSEESRTHSFTLAALGLHGKYTVSDILEPHAAPHSLSGALTVTQAPHSVRMLKLVDTNIVAHAPAPKASIPSIGETGKILSFSASDSDVVSYKWDFGDGVGGSGAHAEHAYTYPGRFAVTLTETGVDGLTGKKTVSLVVQGIIATTFNPGAAHRYGQQ